ncbi:MAG: DivIVA domain-containing protein [Erysipelothrix sp.]|mgnify:CR=1 FL=1|nr:DivIVA domain-containing protein [Erysipelothrix sp.]
MKQRLTVKEIYEKEFHIDYQGYNALEVDAFLDEVIKDYKLFEKLIKEQKELLDRYESSLTEHKRMLHELKSNERASEEIQPQPTYVDLLKRISKLEQAVYNKK